MIQSLKATNGGKLNMFTLLSAANWPIVGQLAIVLGKVMNFIYNILDNMLSTDEGLVGLSIVIYTIFVYTLLLPMTIKQQKTSRITAIMNPELQAIQKKYANKKDQASQLKMREEMQRVYDKYGTSMTGGCVQILIQMPLLFALYPVIYQMENYVPEIKNATADVQKFLSIPDLSMSPSQMIKMKDTFDVAPIFIVITCIALPVISALTQYFSLKLSQKITDTNNKKNGVQANSNDMAAQTMKSMNVTMPLFSLWMVFSLSAGIGVYWIVSAVVRCIQQIAINKYLDKISIDDIIEKNREKADKKRAKREVRAEKMNEMAQMNAKNIEASTNRMKSKSTISDRERAAKLEKAESNRKNAKSGSLASKANMVQKYNDNKK